MTGLDGEVRGDYARMLGVIRAAMRAHHLDSATVAARVGVHRTSVTDWFAGVQVPTVEHLSGLAAVAGLRVVVEDPSTVVGCSVVARRTPVRAAHEVLRLVRHLQARRIACGRGRGWVAQVLGVTEAAVSRWERGRRIPDLFVLLRWARVLGLVVRVCVGGWPVMASGAAGRRSIEPTSRPGSVAARRARAGIRY